MNQLKDHASTPLSTCLGNVRIVLQPGGNMYGTVVQSNDYFPFGMAYTYSRSIKQYDEHALVFDERAATENTTYTKDNRYLYNGKEEQPMPGKWLDYGARFYDAQLGRFHTVDPRTEKYYEWSSYAYVLNNPILNIDPRGDTVRVYTETSGVGHAWLSVGEGENMTVYTYGRYAGTDEKSTGINTLSNGPGVLVKLGGEDAKAYNDKKAETTGSEVFQVLDVKDEDVAKVMDNAFSSSDVMPSKGEYKDDPRARVIDEYSITDNNCATKTSGAINDAGSQAFKPEQISPMYKTSQKPVLPVTLRNTLKIKSYTQSEIVKQQK